jgi:hypothetical protein
VLALSACGGGSNKTTTSADPFAIKRGMTRAEISARLGEPQSVLPSGRLRCLIYPAHKKGSTTDYIVFCLNRGNRVARIYSGTTPIPPA